MKVYLERLEREQARIRRKAVATTIAKAKEIVRNTLEIRDEDWEYTEDGTRGHLKESYYERVKAAKEALRTVIEPLTSLTVVP